MPRQARKNYFTPYFHIIVQGINKEYIFNKEAQITRYMHLIKKYKEENNILLIAYCIMNNHAHFLVKVNKIEELSQWMKKVNTIYAMDYNNQFNRVGYVFRNRYKSQPIYNEKYLLNCIKYIHMNPVKAGIVKKESEYKYSSYRDFVYKNGIITDKLIDLLFENKNNYLKEFFNISYIEEDFIDEKEEIGVVFNQLKIKYDFNKLFMNKQILESIIKELYNRCDISQRQIAELLKIDRNKIKRILNR